MENKCIKCESEMEYRGRLSTPDGKDSVEIYGCYFPECPRYGLLTTVSKP
jgi:hypothetical protein